MGSDDLTRVLDTMLDTTGLPLLAIYDYLDPTSMQDSGPKPWKLAQNALILHIFGVQVGSC